DDRLAGGTGRVFDWATIPEWSRRVRLFLAGGLAPENVATAVERVRPFAVDASSRLERSPGIKDEARLRSFFAALARVREE
ncbi:MAG: N-(5'-phosphoribosyl)anthranilate isomerase, partial [Candidatus Eisenbacteria bacterium]|nr:N-(5'-phosphoribosyl)anthranilate isomerase [Candidatus Eisenbacteria bacterium]